jgi:curli biogenesis system outer membrane secretion channel CsgG
MAFALQLSGSFAMTRHFILTALAWGVTVCAGAQTLGDGGSAAQGSAGPGGAQNANAQLERCDAPKGTIAVVEAQSQVIAALGRYGLQSPTGLIRMLIQQSNCFQVVERGVAMQNMMQERALAAGGQMQSDQNVGKGQMVAADFIVTPNVVFSEGNAGGVGGAIGGLFGRLGGAGAVVGAVAGGLKFKEAQTSMLLADTRSGIQVAAAEGSAKQTDFNLGGALFGGGAGAALGGYTNTNEGKVITASFLDNWNNIVRAAKRCGQRQGGCGQCRRRDDGQDRRCEGAQGPVGWSGRVDEPVQDRRSALPGRRTERLCQGHVTQR